MISFGFNVFSVFLGTSGWTSFSVLLASAAGLDSSPWLVASGFASVSLSDLGFASADGVSATTSLAFSSGLAALAASAVSDAVATPSAFSSLFSLVCSPSFCLSASLVECSLSPETSSVLAPLFSGTAVSSAKAGPANKTAPIISEQAPTDNLRIL
ncbi:Uncharacterised protein [Streptococcus pneumoniae]|nr:Uncharacterised protein [Streptococcus pneumoniae]CAG6267572.1 Uncharacterised protein [Streptococcus pneumoniae]CIV54897.1 Uncharacterised protein [Streptococcus pneumoniae]CIV55003.1 Uncharacterised protein [Streptococcus pneumoniae]CIV77858.1 Uncharacterised protein [Streptococcus pneumoniae]